MDLLDFPEEVRKDTDRPASAIVDATVAWLFFPFINLKMHRTHCQTKYSFFYRSIELQLNFIPLCTSLPLIKTSVEPYIILHFYSNLEKRKPIAGAAAFAALLQRYLEGKKK